MTETDLPWSQRLRPADLAGRKPTRFDLSPDAATRAAIADWAGIEALEALRLKGSLTPMGRSDWLLQAEFTARVVQACVVTLAPVTTDLSEGVERRYLADMPEPTGEEIEMPEDDSAEPLPDAIDLAAVALEALELALPLYPRAPGAELGEAIAAEEGVAPMRDEDTRPFANLRDLLKNRDDDEKNGEDEG